MKALTFEQTGNPPDILSVKNRDVSVPKANEVVVKMLASPINPADFYFLAGTYRFKPEFPEIAGLEGAGIVARSGAGVTLAPNTLVSFFAKNAWAEYVCIPADELFVLPANLPVEKAAQFALNPVTAWGLLEKSHLVPGDWLLLTAGNSTVSKLIIQFAVRRGINIIATIRDPKYASQLNEMGAEVINVNNAHITDCVAEITKGAGVSCVMDAVGGNTGTEALNTLKVDGKHIVYGRMDKENVQFHNSAITYKNLTISGFGIRGYLQNLNPGQRSQMVQSIAGIIASPDFKMDVVATYGIEDFKEAFRTIMDNDTQGKVLFKL
jgi:NADPH2:quinone reductase